MRTPSKMWVVLGVAVTAGLALFTATQQWLMLSLVQGAATVDALALTGQEMNPTLSPIAVAGLAAALALTIAGRVFRYLLGVLIIGFGAGIVLISVGILRDPLNSASTLLSEITGITGAAQSGLLSASTVSAWPTVTLICGVALALIGVLVLATAHTWKQGGRKYEASTGAANEKASASPVVQASLGHDPSREHDRISDWEMMSGGEDPSGDRYRDEDGDNAQDRDTPPAR